MNGLRTQGFIMCTCVTWGGSTAASIHAQPTNIRLVRSLGNRSELGALAARWRRVEGSCIRTQRFNTSIATRFVFASAGCHALSDPLCGVESPL